jgi:putative membrane protein
MLSSVGPLTVHMAVHLLLMNAIAPAAVVVAYRFIRAHPRKAASVFPAMAVQLGLLWMWHAPPLLSRALEWHALHLCMQASLLLSALWFWSAVFSLHGSDRWRGLLALLLTSKIFCLLGVLFVFAPRLLYPESLLAGAHHAHHALTSSLADQQLAGLLMLVVCPASYLTAGVIMAAKWVFEIDPQEAQGRGRHTALAAADAR